MKILKRPDNIIFDTENPNVMEFNPTPKGLPIKLSEITLKSDFDFLSEHFKPRENVNHPIFSKFFDSKYFCVKV
ncbi:MAG: hypothetical protein Q4G63_12420 [Bacteroidia bacterium]|nr:hypothetical protein [Bacteroidia bacterium]